MCSAVDFLPRSITLLMKRASTFELNFGRAESAVSGPDLYVAFLDVLTSYFLALRLAPYFERPCLRLAVPEVSSVPRMM